MTISNENGLRTDGAEAEGTAKRGSATTQAAEPSAAGEDYVLHRTRGSGGVVMQVRRAYPRPTIEQRVRFFDELAQTANIALSAERAGFSKSVAYRRRKSDPAFRSAWDAALDQGCADLEMRLLAMARFGVTEEIVEHVEGEAAMEGGAVRGAARGGGRKVKRRRTDTPALGLKVLQHFQAERAAQAMVADASAPRIDREELVGRVRAALDMIAARRAEGLAAAARTEEALGGRLSDASGDASDEVAANDDRDDGAGRERT